jgi:pimeloyl-ACP methyl ester carboxylesterase
VAQTEVLNSLMFMINWLTDPVDEAFVREFQMSCVHAPVPEPFMEAVIANSRRMPAATWKAVMQGLLECKITLSEPQVRTLVLGGRQDAVFSATEQMTLARQFPRGELHLIDGIGHTLHWEQPQTFVSALTRFGV